jgi:hypothetical protein
MDIEPVSEGYRSYVVQLELSSYFSANQHELLLITM